jgi:radical SAM protein with 4Fe4S-binding SPASM domain
MPSLRDDIFRLYDSQHRLHAAMIEVTHRCPCDCVHCLLVREPRDELTVEELTDILRQLRDEGVLNLGLTGGEPFARRDFPEILEAAHAHRFFLSVLTTGVTVGPPEVALMQRCGVRSVEISLLGAGPDTHDGIMRLPGAFVRTMTAVKLLVTAGLVVNLKTTVLTLNWREVPAMRDLARQLGAAFEANITVAPRIDGDRTPLNFALTETELSQLDPALINAGPIPGEDLTGGAPLVCKAGRTVATIGPRGEVYPCLLFRYELGNLRQRSLHDILRAAPDPFLEDLRKLEVHEVSTCAGCDLRTSCQRCPGIAYLETGDVRAPSPSACTLAQHLAHRREDD